MFFTASKATDSRTTNAYILIGLQMKSEGGDGGMIGQASVTTGLGSTTYYPPKDTKLEVIYNLTAKSGVYPLDAPLEIGRVEGKPMMLTVGKPTQEQTMWSPCNQRATTLSAYFILQSPRD